MLFFHSIFSAYTTTKLKLGGSSPLVITPSEDVYVFKEKADRMRVLRPQLMSAKRLMNVGSRQEENENAPKFLCFTSSSVGGREKTAYEHQVEQGGALSEPNKHIEERFEPVTATNQL